MSCLACSERARCFITDGYPTPASAWTSSMPRCAWHASERTGSCARYCGSHRGPSTGSRISVRRLHCIDACMRELPDPEVTRRALQSV